MNSTSTTYTVKSNPDKPASSPIQYGWKCPSCGAIMAPWQNSCVNCIGTQITATPTITWDSTEVPKPWWWNQVTCDTGKSKETITTTWSSANTTPTSNSLKSAMKSHGINI